MTEAGRLGSALVRPLDGASVKAFRLLGDERERFRARRVPFLAPRHEDTGVPLLDRADRVPHAVDALRELVAGFVPVNVRQQHVAQNAHGADGQR